MNKFEIIKEYLLERNNELRGNENINEATEGIIEEFTQEVDNYIAEDCQNEILDYIGEDKKDYIMEMYGVEVL